MELMQTNRILEIIESRIGAVRALYLFGTAATGQQRPDSDIDLAVLAENGISDRQRWTLCQDLASELGRDVDLIDLRTANTVLRSQILTTARVLYRRPGDPAVEAFEDFAYADYARLNEARAGILADVTTRGEIYGR